MQSQGLKGAGRPVQNETNVCLRWHQVEDGHGNSVVLAVQGRELVVCHVVVPWFPLWPLRPLTCIRVGAGLREARKLHLHCASDDDAQHN